MILMSRGSKIHPQLSPLGSFPPPLGPCSPGHLIPDVTILQVPALNQSICGPGLGVPRGSGNHCSFQWCLLLVGKRRVVQRALRGEGLIVCVCTCIWVSLLSILQVTVVMTELGRSGSGGGPASLLIGREVPQSRPAAGPSPLQSHSTART